MKREARRLLESADGQADPIGDAFRAGWIYTGLQTRWGYWFTRDLPEEPEAAPVPPSRGDRLYPTERERQEQQEFEKKYGPLDHSPSDSRKDVMVLEGVPQITTDGWLVGDVAVGHFLFEAKQSKQKLRLTIERLE